MNDMNDIFFELAPSIKEKIMVISFELDEIIISYKADFSPPILDLALAENQVIFIKSLLEKFQLKYGDLIVNPQNLSDSFIFFRKFDIKGGAISIYIGVDSFATNYVNPLDTVSAWDPSLKVLRSIKKITEIPFRKQTLTFNLNCHSRIIKGIDFIKQYNTYPPNENLKSKGISFNFSGPMENSNIFLVISESIILPNGLFLLIETQFEKEITEFEEIFERTVKSLREKILPSLGLDIQFQE